MTDETKHRESFKGGDINALQALYKHYADLLYSYGIVLCDHIKLKTVRMCLNMLGDFSNTQVQVAMWKQDHIQ